MKQYKDLLNYILDNGKEKEDRTGVGTISTFGYQMRFDLTKGFPLLTTKRTPLRLIVSELLWFLKGDSNIKYLIENNNKIWDEWGFKKWVESGHYNGPDMTDFGRRSLVDEEFNEVYQKELAFYKQSVLRFPNFANEYGDLGPVYGKQWRSWGDNSYGINSKSVDQIEHVINSIKYNPDSRRHIVSAWNPSEVDEMALPPCHTLFQFYVEGGKLSCQLYQRSADVFLGIPFNIASYALLTHLIARECGLEVGEFVHVLGDAHIYSNHMDQVDELLSREERELPSISIDSDKSLFDLEITDIVLEDYNPHPTIKAPVAV